MASQSLNLGVSIEHEIFKHERRSEMRSLKALIIATAMAAALLFIGSSTPVHGQETMMKQAANKVVRGSKTGYRKGRRVGHTIGNRTWTGTKWVASNTWTGGKWILVKTVNGTKWVYRKGKRAVTGTRKRIP
jgi:HJR/Mrr/RecB family endonuclease